MEAYRRYFTQATARELEYYYVYVSVGVMGLLEKWLADGMTASPEEMAIMVEKMMVYGVGFLRQDK